MTDRLSPLDASFLYLEKPNVHMHVAGLAVVDPSTRHDARLTFSALHDLIASRIHLVPRFRQRVVFPPLRLGGPVWVDDQDFDIAFHLRRHALPSPGGPRELADAVQRIHSRHLDRTKPLWEMYLIEGLEDGHAAVYTKTHHAMIDGISGIDIATVLFDFTVEPRPVEQEEWRPRRPPSRAELAIEAVVSQLADPVRTTRELAGTVLRAPRQALELVAATLTGAASLVSKGMAPKSSLNVKVGANRRFAMAEIPVPEVKAIKDALGGTVNDVVLAAMAGALHRFLEGRGEATEGRTLRAMVPVSTRDESQRMALGNQVSSFFIDLPVGPMEATARLRAVSEATSTLKSSNQAVAATQLMQLGNFTPPTLHALAARLGTRQRFANLVISNVPGPQVPMYLAGSRLIVNYPVMPLTETMALSTAVTSLAGVMGFGFTGDWDALHDIDRLPEGLLESFTELKKAAKV